MKVIPVKFTDKVTHEVRLLDHCVPNWKTEVYYSVPDEKTGWRFVFDDEGKHIIYSNGYGQVRSAWEDKWFTTELTPVDVAKVRIKYEI